MIDLSKYINESILDDEDVQLDNINKTVTLGYKWEFFYITSENPGVEYSKIFKIKNIEKEYKKLPYTIHDEYLDKLYNQDNAKVIEMFINILYNMTEDDLPQAYKSCKKLSEYLSRSYECYIYYEYDGDGTMDVHIQPIRPSMRKAMIRLKFKKRR